MTTPQSPNTRPTDLETPGDIDTHDTPISTSSDIATDADTLREQAISDSHARDDLQAKQDTPEERLVAEGEDTSSDIKQATQIQVSGEL
jgi:hypothetical protein